MAHHAAASRHQHEEERAEELGEQPAPFLVRVIKVRDAVFDLPFVASEQSGDVFFGTDGDLTPGLVRDGTLCVGFRFCPARCASARARRRTRDIGTIDLGPVRRGPGQVSAFSRNPMPVLAENGVGDGRNAHMASGLTLILPVRLPP